MLKTYQFKTQVYTLNWDSLDRRSQRF